jgi:hypothetical protein
LHRKRYAVSSSDNASDLHSTPNRGAKCAFSFKPQASGFATLNAAAKEVIAAIALSLAEEATQEAAKALSQRPNSAFPCATLALLPTVHDVLASKSLSKVSSLSGVAYAAKTYGREVEARFLILQCRKKWKSSGGVVVEDEKGGLWCAR